MQVKEDILINSHSLFCRYGIRSVSMDDIARELSISKKTIYQYFKDKDELVNNVTQYHLEFEKDEFNQIAKSAIDPIDELTKISVCLRQNLKDLNPSLVFDLKKYHRKAWENWISFKTVFVRNNIARNLKQGIEEGYYRSEIDVNTLAIYRMEQVQLPFDESIYPREKFSLSEVQLNLFDHFVHGLLTEKGRKLYKEYQEILQLNTK